MRVRVCVYVYVCGRVCALLLVDLIFFVLLLLGPIFYLQAIYKMKFLCKN